MSIFVIRHGRIVVIVYDCINLLSMFFDKVFNLHVYTLPHVFWVVLALRARFSIASGRGLAASQCDCRALTRCHPLARGLLLLPSCVQNTYAAWFYARFCGYVYIHSPRFSRIGYTNTSFPS